VYRPIGLAPASTSAIHAGRASTYADRRRAAADRLMLAESLSTRLDAAVTSDPKAGDGLPIDPDGALRACVRALVPQAHRDPTFDAMVSLGPDHEWAARLSHGDDGLLLELVPGPGRPAAPDHAPTASQAHVAAELAALLWTGTVATR
jgi:hypothetical protein